MSKKGVKFGDQIGGHWENQFNLPLARSLWLEIHYTNAIIVIMVVSFSFFKTGNTFMWLKYK